MFTGEVVVEPVSVSHRWGWFLFMGILTVAVGTLALILSPAATLGTVIVLGWPLALSGIMECNSCLRNQEMDWIFSGPSWRDSRTRRRPSHRDPSCARRPGVDDDVRRLLHGN